MAYENEMRLRAPCRFGRFARAARMRLLSGGLHLLLAPEDRRSISRSMKFFALATLLGLTSPLSPAAAADIYVAENTTGSVLRYDSATGALLGTFGVGVGGAPGWLACAPNGNLLMTRQVGNVVEFDNETGAYLGVFADTGLDNPTGLTVGPNGNLFVSDRDLRSVFEFDGTTGVFVGTFAAGFPGQPFALAFGANGNLFVTSSLGAGGGGVDGSVFELDGTTGAVVREFLTVGAPRGLTFGPNGNLFVSLTATHTVTEFDVSDTSSTSPVRTLSGGLAGPHGLRFSPGGELYVANYQTAQIVKHDEVADNFQPFATVGLSRPVGLIFGTDAGPCPPPSVEPPSVYDVTANPNPVSATGSVALSATIDDTDSGGSIIKSAQYEIRDVDGAVVASGFGDDANCPSPDYLCPVDGAGMPAPAPKPFNSALESVEVTIPAGMVATLGPGVYEACVRGTDADGNQSEYGQEGACTFLVVYDPDAGFVTGGGWIDSPPGALISSPDASGKANFGFLSKYKKGATTPDGETQFQFKAGDLNFHSSFYQWLVIAGPLAQYKGSGTVNGEGNYGFLLTAKDSAISGGPADDTFRIKIWDTDNADALVYDNGTDQAVNGGSIVIHAK